MRKQILIAMSVLGVTAGTALAEQKEGLLERTGQAIENAADATGNAARNATKATGRALENLGEKASDVAGHGPQPYTGGDRTDDQTGAGGKEKQPPIN